MAALRQSKMLLVCFSPNHFASARDGGIRTLQSQARRIIRTP